GGNPRSRSDIENCVTGRESRRAQQKRQEMGRGVQECAVVLGCRLFPEGQFVRHFPAPGSFRPRGCVKGSSAPSPRWGGGRALRPSGGDVVVALGGEVGFGEILLAETVEPRPAG